MARAIVRKCVKIFGLENLQNIFINGFIYPEYALSNNSPDVYILEVSHRKTPKHVYGVSDILRVFFRTQADLNNFTSTTFSNLPVYIGMLCINPIKFDESIEPSDSYFSYDTSKAVANYNFMNIKLGFLTSVLTFFKTERKDIVEIHNLLDLYRAKPINQKSLKTEYRRIFFELGLSDAESIIGYKSEGGFHDMSRLIKLFSFALSGRCFEKMAETEQRDNQMSILSKILAELVRREKKRLENYDFYINDILLKISWDEYEEGHLIALKKKRFDDTNLTLLECAFLILKSGNADQIIQFPEKFFVSDKLKEHVLFLTHALKGFIDGYSGLDFEWKMSVPEIKLTDYVLDNRKKTTKVQFDPTRGLVFGKLVFKFHP